jgi:hypothetical protein
MRFSLKTLLLLPAWVGLVLGHYLFLERSRVVEWDWGRFIGDCLLMFTATASIVGCYATLRTEDRSTFAHGLRRLLLWVAVFVVPFVAGLNPVIGVSGVPNSRYPIRVFDVYSGILAYGLDPLDLVTVGGHVVIAAFLGFAAIRICGRLDHPRRT